MQKYSPLEDRCLIKTVKKAELEKTDGGIIIPETAKKEVAEGIIVAAGPGRFAPENGQPIPCMLNKGDLVLYGINQGLEIEIEGESGRETVRILREGDILMIIEKAINTN